jgi:uncharacterized protein
MGGPFLRERAPGQIVKGQMYLVDRSRITRTRGNVSAMLAEKCLVVDSMLGKLAKWLRILGFDTHYTRLQSQQQVDDLRRTGCLLLTRNHRWGGQAGVVCLEGNEARGQLRELVSLVHIEQSEIRLLQRCLRCNQLLVRIAKDRVMGCVPDYVYQNTEFFHQCPGCHRLYWSGSHPKRITQWLESVLGWSLELDTH